MMKTIETFCVEFEIVAVDDDGDEMFFGKDEARVGADTVQEAIAITEKLCELGKRVEADPKEEASCAYTHCRCIIHSVARQEPIVVLDDSQTE